ncbi:DNA cytosine methyltransferase [Mesorhizobium sp. M4B.F.Ca.ET.089.01.1.1]|uniref:DNA cytosine methyltransferase n=1 Tax=Mesorhizobium sp. M4B.F.Ca.ET.089.01.1.1 TaxID=2496662 RepID=UPI000FE417D3|nr:DNA cytosine methyltransferase [Mesorhizobium sp. M4B.F.Ca.ET.089.01.1.1]RWX65019.1 DNA cytosine methyltransferase [Mesorhizobium sp. M4B.F.Ca.ET.089.01.1.1]
MTAYALYNEIDEYAANWLENLIERGHIAHGVVDRRSIEDLRGDDLRGFTQVHFFAGIGVWSRALRAAGWPDDRRVWTGSCPCQPHSTAAADRARGFNDPRDLWPVWLDLIGSERPDTVFGEQVDDSPAWIDRAAIDLAREDYAFGAIDLPALASGAPHERMRTYIVADTNRPGRREQGRPITVGQELMGVECASGGPFFGNHRTTGELGRVRRTQPGIRLLVDGATSRVGRLRAYGNAIVGEVATAFIKAYLETDRSADDLAPSSVEDLLV